MKFSPIRFCSVSKPNIVNEDAYAEKLSDMDGDVRVNLGCGPKTLSDYINVDMREIEGVEVVAEATNLPWEAGSLAEIASFHFAEHFTECEFKARVLPYWHRMLRDGGVLRVVCLNWEAMLRKLHEGSMDMERFKELTFGEQEHEGNDHFNAFIPKTLAQALEESGFVDMKFLCEEHDNSGCPEMEVVARKKSSPSR